MTLETSERTDGATEVGNLLDHLEDVIASASRLPMTSRVMVDRDLCLDLVDQLRQRLADAFRTARTSAVRSAALLSNGHEPIERPPEVAQREAPKGPDDRALLQAAQMQAQRILEQADYDAAQVRQEADDYAYRVFATMQQRARKIDDIATQTLETLHAERSYR